jgi:hypothetical protein
MAFIGVVVVIQKNVAEYNVAILIGILDIIHRNNLITKKVRI